MKKNFLAAAILALAAIGSASATTISTEYDYNFVSGNPGGYSSNQYLSVGIAQPTPYGTVDFSVQSSFSTQTAPGTDRANGYELGYSYAFPVGSKFTLIPRVAIGAMNVIDPSGGGFQYTSKYYLVSLEAQMPITEKITGYASYSHTGDISDSLVSNRGQIGIDYAISKSFSLRTGLSHTNTAGTAQNGLVVVGSFSF